MIYFQIIPCHWMEFCDGLHSRNMVIILSLIVGSLRSTSQDFKDGTKDEATEIGHGVSHGPKRHGETSTLLSGANRIIWYGTGSTKNQNSPRWMDVFILDSFFLKFVCFCARKRNYIQELTWILSVIIAAHRIGNVIEAHIERTYL